MLSHAPATDRDAVERLRLVLEASLTAARQELNELADLADRRRAQEIPATLRGLLVDAADRVWSTARALEEVTLDLTDATPSTLSVVPATMSA